MAQPPKRPARERPKLMTREEEAADAVAAGAERQGAVAFHHGKARDAPVPSAKRIFLCASVGLQAMTRRARVRTGWTCPRPWPRASAPFGTVSTAMNARAISNAMEKNGASGCRVARGESARERDAGRHR